MLDDPIGVAGWISRLAVIISLILVLIQISKGKSYAIVFGLCFVPSPIFFGDSIHKVILPADLVGVFILVGLLLSEKVRRSFWVLGTKEGALLVGFMFFIPLLGTLMRYFFVGGSDFLYVGVTFIRLILVCAMYFALVNEFYSGKISFDDICSVGVPGFLVYLIGVVLSYFGVVVTDVLLALGSTEGFHEWNDGLGAGSMGLYRGEVGGWAAMAVAVILPWIVGKVRYGALWGAVLVGSAAISASYVGSRQGLIGILVVLVFQSLVIFSGASLLVVKRYILFLAISVVSVVVYISADDALRFWVQERFVAMFLVSGDAPSIFQRDIRIPFIVDRILSFEVSSFLGSGIGLKSSDLSSSPWIMVYVDSDLLWGFQQIGFLGMIFYIYFIILMVAKSIHSGVPVESRAALLSFWILSIIFLFGHFVLMNNESSHIAAVYFIVMVSAVTVGGYYRRVFLSAAEQQGFSSLQPLRVNRLVSGHRV